MRKPLRALAFLKWTLRVVGWAIVAVAALITIVALLIRIPAVQQRLVQRAVAFLSEKTGAVVRLDRISLQFPRDVTLEGLYVEDQQHDTLLYAGVIGVNMHMTALLSQQIQLNEIYLRGIRANLHRAPDSTYNFTFITNALSAGDTVETDTTASSWTVDVGEVDIHDTNLNWQDDLAQQRLQSYIGTLTVTLDKMDLTRQQYDIDEIVCRQIRVSLVMDAAMTDTDTTSSDNDILPDITLRHLDITALDWIYERTTAGQQLGGYIGELDIEADHIDLPTQTLVFKSVTWGQSRTHYRQRVTAPASPQTNTTQTATSTGVSALNIPWKVSVLELDIQNQQVYYDDDGFAPVQDGVDMHHLHIADWSLAAEDIQIGGSDAQACITNMTVQGVPGMQVSGLTACIRVSADVVSVRDFLLRTPYSQLQLEARAAWPSILALPSGWAQGEASLRMGPSTIGREDIQPWMMDMDSVMNLPPTVQVQAALMLASGNLRVENIAIATGQSDLQLRGTVQGLQDLSTAVCDLRLERLHTTAADLNTWLPTGMLPQTVSLPGDLWLKASLRGPWRRARAQASLKSSYGNVVMDVTANLDTIRQTPVFKGWLATHDIHLGKWLKQPEQLGRVNMLVQFEGQGSNLHNLAGHANVRLREAEIQHYTYHDITLRVQGRDEQWSGELNSTDEHLDLLATARVNLRLDEPLYDLVLDVRNADLEALQLMDRTLRLRGVFEVHLATADFRTLNGTAGVRRFAVFNGKALYQVDSLLFVSVDQHGRSAVHIDSDIIQGSFEGTLNLWALPEVFRRQLHHYFAMADTVQNHPTPPQVFSFQLQIRNTDLLTEVLFPALSSFVPGEITGSFDSRTQQLDFNFHIARIQYGAAGVDTVQVRIDGNADRLQYHVMLKAMHWDTLRMARLRWQGTVQHDTLYTKLQLADSVENVRYQWQGRLLSLREGIQFHLDSGLIMNQVRWSAPATNALTWDKTGLHTRDFSLQHGAQRLSIRRDNTHPTLTLLFDNLDLNNLTGVVEGGAPLDGVMSGDVILPEASSASLQSRLKIKGLQVFGQMLGDLSLALDQDASQGLQARLSVVGEGVSLKATGMYHTPVNTPQWQAAVNLERLNLAVVEPWLAGQLQDAAGYISAEGNWSSTTSSPDVGLTLSFHDISFLATAVNQHFSIDKAAMVWQGNEIALRDFIIRDEQQHRARLQGKVRLENLQHPALDLTLNLDDFQLLNTPADPKAMFYGNVAVRANATIAGTIDRPVINLQAALRENSRFTYVVQEGEKSIQDQEGIVVFVDRDAKRDPFLANIQPQDTITRTLKGIDLTANIELRETETFEVVIDPATGDHLTVRGNATFTFHMDPSGDQQLTGRYDITDGAYNLSFYKLVKRKFSIVKGSAITWTGDPLTAQLDIRALYALETSPVELMSGQGGVSDADVNLYKQRLPFEVYLKVGGDIQLPEITFELDMPENKRNALNGSIYARIKDINTRESDLNKQVFSLLVLKRFMADDPFENQAGNDLSSTARRSVSRLLTEQLNRLSANVKGVQLTFDLRSYDDYTSGQAQGQTQLQLGLSKTLLDNRLVVKVAGNVGLEGQATQQRSVTDYIGDLALEYKLTEDGRFRITGFRNSNYDMIDGELIETGAGLIYIKDYDALHELFKANEKHKE